MDITGATASIETVSYSDLPDSVKAEYDRIGREREQASRDADRAARRELLRVCGELIGWTVLSLLIVGGAFATTDRDFGLIYLYAAFVVNYGGIAISLWMAFRRGQDRGDW